MELSKKHLKAYKYYRNGRDRKMEVQAWAIDDAEEGIEGICILVGKENGERHSVTISRKLIKKLLKIK